MNKIVYYGKPRYRTLLKRWYKKECSNIAKEENTNSFTVLKALLENRWNTSTLYIPEGITKICNGGLHFESVEAVYLPDSCTEIEQTAISGRSLCQVSVGKNCKYIGQYAFGGDWYYIDKFKLILNSSIPPNAERVFPDDPQAEIEIYVPDSAVEVYKVNGYWRGYANSIKPLSQYNKE